MTDYRRLTDDEAKALERFFRMRDRLAELNLASATLRSTGKLITARLPHVSGDRAPGQALRTTLAARWNSARRLHLGVVSASIRTMRNLTRARRAAALGD